MLILRMIKDMFNEMPTTPDIYKYFQSKREEVKNDRKFFMDVIQYLGGRSYNKFLDYSLFAIKIVGIYRKYLYWHDTAWHTLHDEDGDGVVNRLLFDDRHDLWQNLPYILDDAINKANADKKPITIENVNAFWSAIVTALIECINLDGTSDASVHIKYPLKKED